MPIWIGGRTQRSSAEPSSTVTAGRPSGSASRQSKGCSTPRTPGGLRVVLGHGGAIDPLRRPDEAEAALATAAAAGATICTPHFVSNSLDHYLEQLGRPPRDDE